MKPKKPIETLITTLRGQKVILDADLGSVYGVETRVLNQAVKRNTERFPDDFIFELIRDAILRISQTVTSLENLKISKQAQAFSAHVLLGRRFGRTGLISVTAPAWTESLRQRW